MRYSYSRIRCFRECPRSFRFEYIDRIEIEGFETIESFMGSKVHEALDFLYKEILDGNLPRLKELVDIYQAAWDKDISPAVVVNRQGSTHDDYKKAGTGCLEAYYNEYSPFDDTKTLASEMKVDVDLLGDGKYKFTGFVDRLDLRPEGAYEIHDYKTSNKLPSQQEKDRDEQLALYELGIRQKFGHEGDVELVWHYLRQNKEIRSRRTKENLEDLKEGLLSTIKQINQARKEDFYRPMRTRFCSWCAYNSLCIREGKNRKTRQTTLEGFAPFK